MRTNLYDRIAASVIASPLRRPAAWLLRLSQVWHRLRHPALREIYLEAERTKCLLGRTIAPDMNCIDVGCHLGSVLAEITRLSPRGHHIAVEPVPHKATWLRRNFPGVEVHQVALGDQDASVEFFFFPGSSAFSGLSRRGASPDETTVITVKCKRLDDIVPPGMPIGFIKIDVEGAEISVFRGARRVISESQPVVLFECVRSNLISAGLTANHVFSLLAEDISYNIFLLPDWLSGGPPLDLPTFEACMVYPFRAFNFVAAPRFPERR